MNASKVVWAAFSCAALAAGCASTPQVSSELEAARTAVDQAKSDQRVVDHAAVELQEAQKDLAQAEALAADRGAEGLAAHYAYLATREANEASARGELGAVKQAIAESSAQRDEMRLQAREAQIQQAQGKVQMAQSEADLARAQADEMARRLAELEAKQTERGLVLTLQDVLFDVDRTELKPGAMRTIEDLAAFMKDYPDRRVRIEGFTDSTGSSDYNLQLSEGRAYSVRDALMRAGVDSTRIELHGYGEEYPVASNDTNEGRQLNRRVEIVISDEEGVISARANAS
jgi:outer membrane protein OmpA-like peptidoglycan-associated protein